MPCHGTDLIVLHSIIPFLRTSRRYLENSALFYLSHLRRTQRCCLEIGFLSTLKMVADALIYHPAVSHFNKFVATTGRWTVQSVTQDMD